MKQFVLVGVYLVAIVAANLIVARFGSASVLLVGFFLVGLDLSTRDYLHELWKRRLWLKMFGLIAAGSLLSWVINHNAGSIAVASLVAFASAGVVDVLTYHILRHKTFLLKVNGSNVFSGLTDSTVFLSIAFGGFMPFLILAQWIAKVIGGFAWSLVITWYRRQCAVLSRNA